MVDEQRQYWFGEFHLDVAGRTLRFRDEAVPITPKAFETLLMLVENAGRAVAKETLLQRVWADTHVEEATLVQNIFTLRKLLAEKAPGVNLIETVPKIGYRFAVQVRDTPKPLAAVPTGSQRSLWIAALAVLVVLGVIALALVRYPRGHKVQSQKYRRVAPEAREAYLKGVYAWNRRTEQGYITAIEYFNQALKIDAKYAEAYAGLADAYALLGSIPNSAMTRGDAMERARQSALRAIALDDSLADAHTSLAFVRMHYDFDWNGSESEFRRALQLNPNYATAHQWYAYLLMATGRTDAAIAEMRTAERLDPLSMIIHCDMSELLRLARRYPEAEQQARRAVELDPDFVLAHNNLGQVLEAESHYDEALREFEIGLRIDSTRYWLKAARTRLLVRQHAGDPSKTGFRQLLKDTPHETGAALQVATVYAAMGNKDLAIEYLRRALREHDGSLILIRSDSYWDPLRSDARFQQIVHELGLS